jgi:tetratricopeptide (TPR) repeat protein
MCEAHLVNSSSPEGAHRKPTLASVVSAIARILLRGLGFGKTPERANAEALVIGGIDLGLQGKLDEAIAAYRKAIQLYPDHIMALDHLVWSVVLSPKRRRRDSEEALMHARKAVELSPKTAIFDIGLALAQYRLGHWTGSLAACEQSMALRNGENAYGWFILALANWQKGDRDQARSCFDRAVARTEQTCPEDTYLRQLWTEAAELLGQSGPDAAGADSPATPETEKPRWAERPGLSADS